MMAQRIWSYLTGKVLGKNKQSINIFVYGTLKVGGRFARQFDGVRKKVRESSIGGTMFNVNGMYPMILIGTGDTIFGELHTYSPSEGVLDGMDRIEGYPSLYGRTVVPIGRKKAWVYHGSEEQVVGLEKIKSGIWGLR